MTLKQLLASIGVQLEHIHRINPDGSLCVMLTQVGTTQLPLSGRHGKRVLPYMDTNMHLERSTVDDRDIVSISFMDGDLYDGSVYVLETRGMVLYKNGTELK